MRGAYVYGGDGEPEAVLIATGSEVSVALAARELLAERGICARVVSMPSWEVFEAQDERYRESVLPSSATARVSVEAGATLGWERYAGASVGIERFGASAPGAEVMEKLGITPEKVAGKVMEVLALRGPGR